ncbi:MAG: YfiR family protein [Vicinamibacteria bacterium]
MTLALALGVAATSDLRGAQEAKPSEYEVKAVYLYNFGKFTQWPAGAAAGASFDICVLGDDPFGPLLDATISGETLDGKRAVAKRIKRAEAAASCRILFISGSEKGRLDRILKALENKSVLTVSDIALFSRRGGMIELVEEEARIRFEVNLAAATRAGLTLRSELLKVARRVRPNSGS